jgi:hypothetical protein
LRSFGEPNAIFKMYVAKLQKKTYFNNLSDIIL